jgi:sugar phosphate permease
LARRGVNISIAIPLMQKSLGVSKTKLGFIASALQISYGVGKFGDFCEGPAVAVSDSTGWKHPCYRTRLPRLKTRSSVKRRGA